MISSGSGGQMTSRSGSFSTTQNTLQTALSVSGAGVLNSIQLQQGASQSAIQFKITVDGVVFFDTTSAASGSQAQLIFRGSGVTPIVLLMTASTDETITPVPISFKSSLLIELKSDGTRTATAKWHVAY